MRISDWSSDGCSSDLAVTAELERLHRAGLKIGIATGRGGSAGESLRRALPACVHSSVLMGYYNGGYLQTLDIDIEHAPAPPADGMGEVLAWLDAHPNLFSKAAFRRSGVQITVDLKKTGRGHGLTPVTK